MSIGGGPVKALERGRSIGCSAIQVFVKNNLQWFAGPFPSKDADLFLRFADRPTCVFGHTGYLINLGTNKPGFLEKSQHSLTGELVRADQLKLPFLVLHPGAHLGDGEENALRRVASSLDAVLRARPPESCGIALEVTAGQGSCLGYRFEHLAEIIARSEFPERLHVCLDTAHLFAAGYDISFAAGFWDVMKSFDKIVGLHRLAAWHLNDSKTALQSRVDRHEHIGKGKIGLAPFREIMNAPEFRGIPKVLETPKQAHLKEDVQNLATLRRLLVPAQRRPIQHRTPPPQPG